MGDSPIPYDPAGATVSTQFAGDFDISQSWTSHGPSIVSCQKDNATSGAANIRSGHPGDVSLVRFHSGLLGVGHRIDAVSMSFRYQTGFTGADKKAPIVRLLLLDADNKELKTVAQTDELREYDGKHSPPIFLNATGLDVANDDEVFLAIEVTNNEPGFLPPANRSLNSDGVLTLGPYGIALVTMPSDDLIV